MKKKIFVVAAIIISSQLSAQDTTGKTLDEVALTTNKYPKKQSETGKVITIINRQQLERNSGKTVGEVLNTIAGTTIIGANNNPGTNLRTSIRGSSDGNVLILIDGIPVNDPSVNKNYFDLNFFIIDQVERIEILKGGQSTLYGSDAVAGVINIITRKNGSSRFGVSGGITGGSYNSFKENVALSGNTKLLNYTLQYAHLSSDGFSTAEDTAGNKNFEKDGFNQHAVNSNLAFKLNPRLQINLVSGYNYYIADLDASAFHDEKDYTVVNKNVQGGTGLKYTHQKGSLNINYLFNYVSRVYEDDSAFKGSPFLDYSKNSYIGRTHFAEFYNNWKWSNWEVLVGADYRMNNMMQSTFYIFPGFPLPPASAIAKMNQLSPYGSLIYHINNFTVEGGGRINIHSDYGGNVTYTLNPSYEINRKARVFANLYSSFKAPTLYQLFDPSYGNADLEPEKGITGEIGVSVFPADNFDLRAVGFYRKGKNIIEFIITDPNTFASQYQNISEQETYGGELEVKYNHDRLSIDANFAYTDGKTKADYDGTGFPLGKDTSYYNLYRIPKTAINLNVGYQVLNNLFVSTRLKAVGKRFEPIYGAAPEELKSYYTIDLYGEYKVKAKLKLFLDLKNITDKKYVELLGYNTRRFNFTAGVGFTF